MAYTLVQRLVCAKAIAFPPTPAKQSIISAFLAGVALETSSAILLHAPDQLSSDAVAVMLLTVQQVPA